MLWPAGYAPLSCRSPASSCWQPMTASVMPLATAPARPPRRRRAGHCRGRTSPVRRGAAQVQDDQQPVVAPFAGTGSQESGGGGPLPDSVTRGRNRPATGRDSGEPWMRSFVCMREDSRRLHGNERTSPATRASGPWMVVKATEGSSVRGIRPSGGGRKPGSAGSSLMLASCSASPSRSHTGAEQSAVGAGPGPSDAPRTQSAAADGADAPSAFLVPLHRGGDVRPPLAALTAAGGAGTGRDCRDGGKGQEHPHPGGKGQPDPIATGIPRQRERGPSC